MFRDDESDLTDLSDSESESEQPLAALHRPATTNSPPKPKVEKKKSSAGPRLKEPHIQAVPVESIYNELKAGTIDVNPEYQRSVVWSDLKQGYLIDSLMHNYVVFPLVFAERTQEEDEVKIKVCIDGKQRITAIQQDGKIPYRDSQLNKDMWYEEVPKGKKGMVLTPAQRQRFLQTMVSTCRYPSISEHDEREVFQRVQNGVALSTHERLRAINGPNGDLVREMHRQASKGLREYLGWEKSKGKDFFMISQIAILVKDHLSKQVCATTEIKLPRVESFLGLKTAPTGELRDGALRVVNRLNDIHDHPQLMDALSSIQPQWFVMAGFLIYVYGSRYSTAQLADAVRKMRTTVKPETAAKTYKRLVTFVMKEVPSLELNDLVGGRCSAAFLVPSITSAVHAAPAPSAKMSTKRAPATTPQKRRRAANQVDSDAEYSPQAEVNSTKRRRTKRLAYEDEDNEEEEPVVRTGAPPKVRASRISIATASKALEGGSPAQTKIKQSPTSKTTTSYAEMRPVNRTQTARPTIKPLRSKNPTTAGAVSSTIGNRTVGTQQRAAPSNETACMPTPPTSSANSFVTPIPCPKTVPSPLPTPTSRHASQLFDDSQPSTPALDGANRSMDCIKAESTRSPSIPSYSTPPFPAPGRLAPLRAAKAMILNQTAPGNSSQQTSDLRPRRQSQAPAPTKPPKDNDEEYQSQFDHLMDSLSFKPVSSRTPTSASANTTSSGQPRSPVSTSADIIMADGTRGNGVSNDALAFEHLVAVKKVTGAPFKHTRPTPRLASIDTGASVDQLRNPSMPRTPAASQPVSAATPSSEHSFSVRAMAPISKIPSQPASMRSMPSRATSTMSAKLVQQSGSMSSSGSFQDEGGYGRDGRPRPSGGYFSEHHSRSR